MRAGQQRTRPPAAGPRPLPPVSCQRYKSQAPSARGNPALRTTAPISAPQSVLRARSLGRPRDRAKCCCTPCLYCAAASPASLLGSSTSTIRLVSATSLSQSVHGREVNCAKPWFCSAGLRIPMRRLRNNPARRPVRWQTFSAFQELRPRFPRSGLLFHPFMYRRIGGQIRGKDGAQPTGGKRRPVSMKALEFATGTGRLAGLCASGDWYAQGR